MPRAWSAGWRRCAKPSVTRDEAATPSRVAVSRLRLAALVLLVYLVLAAPQAAVAQAPGPSPSARELQDEYPLHPRRETARARAQAPTPTAAPESSPSSRASLRQAMVALVIVLGFATGFALSVRSGRRRPRAESDSSPDPVSPASDLAPPSARRAWTAEIEWAPAEHGACFCVVARPVDGGGPCVVAESAQLEWPPTGAAAVAAMTAAADDLEARLVAAGWRPLPRGDAWYARRFRWEPAAPDPRAAGKGPPEALWREPRDSAHPMGGVR
jgi:hypothetical protein